jgi:hypothetical protein
MSPMFDTPKLPNGFTLERRHVCAPRADERPTLRDEQGRVRAVVEQWRPEQSN